MDDSSNEVVVFYHLPKSGGTTLNGILRRNYRPEEMVECGPDTHAFIAEMKTWPPERLAAIRLLQGHFPFGLHEMLPQPARCFTLLRDPVERVISYYYHARREPAHYLYNLIHDNNWSLQELLDSGLALMMNDGQVRLMSAVWGDAPFGAVDDAMLATAIANLHACAVVGLTEEFDLSLLYLRKAFGWRDINYTRANVGQNRSTAEELPAETVETVRRYNQLDSALYQEAHQIMTQQAGEFGKSLILRKTTLNLRNRITRI